MTVSNGLIAETWRELFAAEGLSVRVIPPVDKEGKRSLRAPRTLYVPSGKSHVAREILRKI
ncbi:MAG: hypothetical protein ACE5EF_14580 [Dehalococcoidia bacterium]